MTGQPMWAVHEKRVHRRRGIRLGSVDDYLGPAEERFFGAGYRRSRYLIRETAHTSGELHALADVTYPADWSRKRSGTALTPHLSTVDVMVLGIRCAEILLDTAVGLSSAQIGRAAVRKLVVRAGASPQEQLAGVPIRSWVKRTDALRDVPAGRAAPAGPRALSTVETRVGAMLARASVEHDASSEPGGGEVNWAVLRGMPDRYWGTGYRDERQQLARVEIDMTGLAAAAELSITRSAHREGIGASAAAGPTPLGAFVALLQLGEVLLYELDGLDRASSDTLWMQRVVLTQGEPSPAGRGPYEAGLEIADHQLVRLPSGYWRNADLRGRVGGIGLSATFAHRVASGRDDAGCE